MIQAPIFHVNGDDPEALVRVATLAFAFRQEFHKDVVIDLVCYRLRGHNEADDPSFTQPLMYDMIAAKRSVRKLYTEALIGRGDITLDQAEQAMRLLGAAGEGVRRDPRHHTPAGGSWLRTTGRGRRRGRPGHHRGARRSVIKKVVDTQVSLPDGFTPHPRLLPSWTARPDGRNRHHRLGVGELLAFGTLLMDGHAVRLVGQDTRRGTFGQRHAGLVDRHTGEEYTPLRALNNDNAKFFAYDSLLSEFAAVGFEYGYSVARPDALVCWEAQFGDFVNGAQTILDEFISSGEQKWGQRSGVVLLLPHGYEGQGPDHSSARVERFMSLCAQDNMRVAMPSTPASYFHLLRWHVLSDRVKPLVVFTPKSMLRLKTAVSAVADFTAGSFQPVLTDPGVADPAQVRRILLCSGKVYYDLAEKRREQRGETSRWSGSSGSTRCPRQRSPRRWPATPTPPS